MCYLRRPHVNKSGKPWSLPDPYIILSPHHPARHLGHLHAAAGHGLHHLARVVELLLRAAMSAPSARNRRPWAFIVVDNKALLRQLADSLPYAAECRCGSDGCRGVRCADRVAGCDQCRVVGTGCGGRFGELAAGGPCRRAGEAVWTGVYSSEDRVRAVRNVLGLPRRVVPLNVIPIGYPAENPALKQKWDPAKVRCNGWAE